MKALVIIVIGCWWATALSFSHPILGIVVGLIALMMAEGATSK